LLVFVPDDHQSTSFVFGERLNESGTLGGDTGGLGFWFLVAPVGFLLGMYTQTGYDASAHTAEETRGAAVSAAQGVWRSIFFSALIGWFVLLAFLFAATDVDAVNEGAGTVFSIFESSMDTWAAKLVILIATVGQLFCGAAGLTSASRTWYAFSRDRAIPGWRVWSRVDRRRVPAYSVIAVAVAALVISLPALKGNAAGVPWAFVAVVSITTIGLYIAYVIPIYLRLRAGDKFQPGAWNLGRHYRWMGWVSVIWTALMVIVFSLPFVPAGVPGNADFDVTAVNYSLVVNLVLFAAVGIWWLAGARDKFTGPVRNIEFDEAMGIVEEDETEATEPPAGTAPTPAG
jgi:amino acid transporter